MLPIAKEPQSCEALAASEANSSPPPFIPAMDDSTRNEFLWSSAGSVYVKCEIDANNVAKLLVLKDDFAIATLKNGSSVEFSLPSSAGWFTAYAASSGVVVESSTEVSLPTNDKLPPSSQDSSAGFVVLGLIVFSIALWAFFKFRRRKTKVAIHSVGTSKSSSRPKDVPSTKFADVAGCKEAIDDLAEMVDVLKNPERYKLIGAKPPKGALLVGPPGTGKTLLARAVAGEAGVPFFSAAGSDFVEMYVGVGAKRVREVFEKARKAGRAIVFIDEIDAVGRRRSNSVGSGGEQELENTLVALLNELDGFASSNVVVLAATNRPDILDSALTRPGRLDRKVYVGLPDIKERELVLKVHSRNLKLDKDVSMQTIAQKTPGFSGAQLEQVCNEAALLAARSGSEIVSQPMLEESVEYVALGRKRLSAHVTSSDKKITAWHEAGHAVVGLIHQDFQDPVSVSIVPRGSAGGVTWFSGSESNLRSRKELQAQIVVALAGRAAEEILLAGEFTAGAANDLVQATEVAKLMVEKFGMSNGSLTVDPSSEASSRAVEDILQEAFLTAKTILRENSGFLAATADALLVKEEISLEDLKALYQPATH
jgi:cell division protease FtsH